MKQDALVWDCDEVLLDHLGGFRKFVIEHYDIEPKTDMPDEYDLTKWLGVTQAEVQEMIKHFNQRSHEFGLLEPLESNTVDIMKELRYVFKDKHFVVLTKSGTGGHGKVLRQVNLMNVFGIDFFDEIIIIEMYESKKSALYKLQMKYNVRFLVDDYIANIQTAMDLGIKPIMMAACHNYEYSDSTEFDYVPNWFQLRLKIYEILKN